VIKSPFSSYRRLEPIPKVILSVAKDLRIWQSITHFSHMSLLDSSLRSE
jgi:hypothetical protein